MNYSSNDDDSKSVITESESTSRTITDSESVTKSSSSYPTSLTTTTDSLPSALRSQAHGSLAAARKKRLISSWSPLRQHILRVVESRPFNNSILSVILLNTVIVAVQTDKNIYMKAGWYLSMIDNLFLGIYISEFLLKAFVFRSNYFKSGWNSFDFFIVCTSFVDWLKFGIMSSGSFNPKIFRLLRVFRAIRAIRGLRALRAVSFLQSLQMIVSTLLKSIPALGSIVVLLFLVMFIFAIIGRTLYGDMDQERFGSMGTSIFTLFMILSLDDWFKAYRDNSDKDPSIVIYLIAFIVMETFIFINLFIAVIVNNLQASQSHQKKKAKKEKAQEIEDEEKATRAHASARKNPQKESSAPKSIDDVYPEEGIPHKQKQLMGQYLMLLASLENNADMYENQHRVLDGLVDIMRNNDEENLVFV